MPSSPLTSLPPKVYDLPSEVLATLTLKTDVDSHPQLSDISSTSPPPDTGDDPENAVGSRACSLCGLSFAVVQDQRSHLKSDWHQYNLKQKLRGNQTVTEVEFEKLIESMCGKIRFTFHADTISLPIVVCSSATCADSRLSQALTRVCRGPTRPTRIREKMARERSRY